jgi:DNA-binding beta-propeller fold protein YncE
MIATLKSSKVLIALIALAAFCLAAPALAADYTVIKNLPIGGEGRWDYITVDPATKIVYVGRSAYTQAIDTNTGKVVGTIKDTAGVHGVALVPELNRGFTSNGRSNNVTIFDLKDYKTLGTIETGKNPDAIIYEPSTKTIITFNGRSNDCTVIDANAEPGSKAKATIELGGKPESAASDNAGHVYVNIEDKSEVVDIDTKDWKVANRWKIDGGEEPSGLALDPTNHHLFLGCGGNNVMAILDTQTGKTLTTLPIGKGVDACGFDPGTNEAFASCGDGTVTAIKETSPGKFQVTQTIKTHRSARTMCVDPTTHTLYLPAAETEPSTGGGRPQPKPNSFMIVVVGQEAK